MLDFYHLSNNGMSKKLLFLPNERLSEILVKDLPKIFWSENVGWIAGCMVWIIVIGSGMFTDLEFPLLCLSLMIDAKLSKLHLSDEQLLEIPSENLGKVFWYQNVGSTAVIMTGVIMQLGRYLWTGVFLLLLGGLALVIIYSKWSEFRYILDRKLKLIQCCPCSRFRTYL